MFPLFLGLAGVLRTGREAEREGAGGWGFRLNHFRGFSIFLVFPRKSNHKILYCDQS